jgi:hypothetical protein
LIKPGDSQNQEARFRESPPILPACGWAAATGASGLDRYSIGEGQCLAQVRVVSNDVMRFEK